MSSVAVASTSFVPRKRIPVIGIVGGIGSGKSAVAEWVAAHANVIVINADSLGHEALRSDTVKKSLCERFGHEILGADGEILRSALAEKVFGSDAAHLAARRDLEKIVHPEIGIRIAEQIEAAATDKHEAVLLDAAILLEAGWRNKCDLVVYVDTPDQIRLDRVGERRGWTESELRRREQSQWSLTDKRRECDLIVSNDSNLEVAGQQLMDSLQQRGLIIQKTR